MICIHFETRFWLDFNKKHNKIGTVCQIFNFSVKIKGFSKKIVFEKKWLASILEIEFGKI